MKKLSLNLANFFTQPKLEKVDLPMCLLVTSTVGSLLTLDSKPRQNLSELDGSTNPSIVREGWEAWKVSPTLWFIS